MVLTELLVLAIANLSKKNKVRQNVATFLNFVKP